MTGVETTLAWRSDTFFFAAARSFSAVLLSREGLVVGLVAGLVVAFSASFSAFTSASNATTSLVALSISAACSGVGSASVGVSSRRSASSVWSKMAKDRKYSSCVIGSNLWEWHWAQAIVRPIHTWYVVLTRSTTAAVRNSSSSVPPSSLFSVLRW